MREAATRIVTTFDICRFQGVTALALTILWKVWVFAINMTLNSVILSVRVYRGFLLLMCTFAMRLAHTFSVKQLEPFVIEINFKVARLDGLRPLAAC
jgi:hypothetical protein